MSDFLVYIQIYMRITFPIALIFVHNTFPIALVSFHDIFPFELVSVRKILFSQNRVPVESSDPSCHQDPVGQPSGYHPL